MNIVVSGGTGFIGKALVPALIAQGHKVTLLVRKPVKFELQFPGISPAAVRTIRWDGRGGDGVNNEGKSALIQEIDGADAVINLAGESIGTHRWSELRKLTIERSRIDPTNAIVHAIAHAGQKPRVLISGSAVGYYGNVSDGDVTEEREPGSGFLPEVCVAWERESLRAKDIGVRTVLLRTGIVLEKDGGALQKILTPFRLFAGGPLGSGKQWMPWIHRDDIVRAIVFLLENDNIEGPVNITAPHPVTMNAFALTLGKVLRRPSWARVPEIVLRLILGEMSALVLEGQRAIPKKLNDMGFHFSYETLEPALQDILAHE